MPQDNDKPIIQDEKLDKERRDRISQLLSNVQQGQIPSVASLLQNVQDLQQNVDYQRVKGEMSSTGQNLMDHFEEMVQTSHDLVSEKQVDEHLQCSAEHVKRAVQLTSTAPLSIQKSEFDEIQHQFVALSNRMVDLSKLFVTSASFRNAFIEFAGILQELVVYNLEQHLNPQLQNTQLQSTMGNIKDKTFHQIINDLPIPSFSEQSQPSTKQPGQKTQMEQITQEVQKIGKETVKRFEVPTEYQDRLIHNLKASIKSFQADAETQKTLQDSIQLSQELMKLASQYSQIFKGKINEAFVETEAYKEALMAIYHVKELLENFANNKSLNPVLHHLRILAGDIYNNPELDHYLKECNQFLLDSIQNAEILDQPVGNWERYAKELFSKGQQFLNDEYSATLKHTMQLLQDWLNGFSQDEMNTKLAENVEQITQDMFYDEQGNLTVKPELLKDFVQLLPVLADCIGYIPVPEINYEDDDYQMSLSNLILKCSRILPSHIKLLSSLELDSDDMYVDGNLYFSISKIHASARDVCFFYRKKSGLIHIKDTGLLNFDIYGEEGLSLTIHLKPYANETEKGVSVVKCKARIDKLRLRLHDSKHDFLYSILRPTLDNVARKQIENMIEKNVQDLLIKFTDN